MVPLSALFALTACGLATAVTQQPKVQIQDGTVIGFTNNSIDNFLGIPYADTPERLRPPQRLSSPFGTLNATAIPASCPQHPLIVNPEVFTQLPPEVSGPLLSSTIPPSVVSEDCLNLIIQRPSSTTPDSRLPVLFWIYGGGFATGSSVPYDYSTLIQESVTLGQPIIVVRVNYRVGAFGFLPGKELQNDGGTNLGLRDQRLALEWVSENIAAFGGDPDKVTIWGESAGSISVMYHALINNGNSTYRGKPLFRGGIMDSGAVLPAEAVDSPTAQGIFESFSAAAGCGLEDALTCLRGLPYEEFLNATAVIPGLFGPEAFRLSFPPRPDPRMISSHSRRRRQSSSVKLHLSPSSRAIKKMKTQQPALPYNAVVQYYVNFINSLDPNVDIHGKCEKKLPHWPKWDKDERLSIHFLDNATVVAPDDDRKDAFEYFSGVQSELLF
ncbi:unnamed protein product [Clonostachys rosea f. rosea IK726]|uniref:Uncharacterized protein n=1 Tax=Clonostachys rosea f. rosea IK726 TaxID=1349383 RepID=A0ACA9U7T8_BIOOC|nr:unnamed protein product [Clonostachys rosea f. rosea IK726]